MQILNQVLRTSEFWSGLLAVVLGFLVQQGVITQAAVAPTQQFIGGLAAYVAGRIAHKVVNGAVPFQPRPR